MQAHNAERWGDKLRVPWKGGGDDRGFELMRQGESASSGHRRHLRAPYASDGA